jgi:drug/metabolite transporter (DMT)-like permease
MGVIAPFRYAVILFAIALGYLVWGDIPDIFTITGTVIVVATGLYTIHRERLRSSGSRT